VSGGKRGENERSAVISKSGRNVTEGRGWGFISDDEESCPFYYNPKGGEKSPSLLPSTWKFQINAPGRRFYEKRKRGVSIA